MSTRQLVIIDTETSSLDVETAALLEVAAINTAAGEELHFVPWHSELDIAEADPESLKVNGYRERGLAREMLDLGQTIEFAERLGEMLDGNTLGGANPRFDARMLELFLGAAGVLPGWHHRLADVSAYTAGALRLPPHEMPGLHECCELLGVDNTGEHSALGDARATAECFARTGSRARVTRSALATLALSLALAGAGAAFAAFLSTSWLVELLERHATRMETR